MSVVKADGQPSVPGKQVAARDVESANAVQASLLKISASPSSLNHWREVFVHVETHSKKLDVKAWEGRLVGHSGNMPFCIYNPATREVLESRKSH